MTRYATIDVGSNSALIHVAERRGDGSFEVLADRSEVCRLGEGLRASGRFSPEAMDRTAAALGSFMALARQHEVSEIAAVGTMALRNAANAAAFVERMRAELGLEIQVIEGEEEARLSFLAVRSGLAAAPRKLAIFDVGGGSTEFIFGSAGRIEDKFSLDVGALRLTEQYLDSDPVAAERVAALLTDLDAELGRLQASPETLVGMGGAITNMAAVYHGMTSYDPSIIQGTELRRDEIERQVALYTRLPIAGRRQLPGLQPKRADTILAGAAIVATVMRRLGTDRVIVSDRGLRHGLLADRFGG